MRIKIWAFAMVISLASVAQNQKIDSLTPGVYHWDSLAVKENAETIKSILEGSTTSLARFEVHSVTISASQTTHASTSSFNTEELIIVKSGQVKVTIDNNSKTIGPGSIAFFMPGDIHGIENAGSTAATYYVLTYKSKGPTRNASSFMINWNDLPQVKTEKGYRREFFNKPTSQLEKFEMHTTALNVGLNSHAPHTHKEEEIILILRGNVEMNINGVLYKANPGDVVFLPSMVSHNLTNIGNEQCEYFAFQWRN